MLALKMAARIAFVLMIPTLAMCGIAIAQRRAIEPLTAAASITTDVPNRAPGGTNSPTAPASQQDAADGEVGATDLYGNAVTEAVATYKLDAEGSLYELHSPQTELPKLGSPKS